MKATTPEAGFTLTPLPEGENGMSIAVLKGGNPDRSQRPKCSFDRCPKATLHLPGRL